MSLTATFENKLQLLLFQNSDINNIGDNTGIRGSTSAGNWTIALHTADPTESPASQSASEATYDGYARQNVARSGAGWTVSNNQVSNAAQIQFGQSTGSPASQTVTHFSLGFNDAGSPTGEVFYVGALSSGLNVTNGVNPTFSIGQLQISVD
jgi:hypothetical protein